MKLLSKLFLFLCVFYLSSCGIFIPVSMGDKIENETLNKFKVCETTSMQMQELAGEPFQRGNQSGYATMRWNYSSMSAFSQEYQTVIAFFNRENVLIDYSVNPVGLVVVNDQCS